MNKLMGFTDVELSQLKAFLDQHGITLSDLIVSASSSENFKERRREILTKRLEETQAQLDELND
jgi:hypothetical protein